MSLANIAMVVFFVAAGLLYLGVSLSHNYLELVAGIAALLSALFIIAKK